MENNHFAKEEKEVREIKRNLRILKNKLVERIPYHFSKKDMVNAFFGSLIIGLTFMFKGALVQTGAALSNGRIIFIILLTLTILIAEIYFIGYSRIRHKKQNHFKQFLSKRLFSLYSIALVVSFLLVYTFGVDILAGSFYETMKIVIILAMPCAVGAAIPSLFRSYY